MEITANVKDLTVGLLNIFDSVKCCALSISYTGQNIIQHFFKQVTIGLKLNEITCTLCVATSSNEAFKTSF